MPTPRRKKPSRAGTYGKGPRRGAITAAQFREARVFAGLTRERAAEFLGVSLRTIGHWETGKARPAFAAFKLLRVLRHGELVDPAWDGYRLVRGKLVTPENREFSPADLAWLSLLVRRSHAFSELLREREARAAAAARGARAGRAGRVRRRSGCGCFGGWMYAAGCSARGCGEPPNMPPSRRG